MKEPTELTPRDVEIIFRNSPANKGHYDGEKLPEHKWSWPESTWLKRRIAKLRNSEISEGR